MLYEESLILHHILFKYMQWKFQLSLEYFSPKITIIQLNFGNVLVIANGLFMK